METHTIPLLRTEEAAAYLGVSPSLLSKLRLTGAGPIFLRLGAKAIRYRRADLDRWAEAGAARSTSEYPAAQPHGAVA